MGDSFTNLLLITLITLLGYIGKVFYDKIEAVLKRVEDILLSDVSQKKDIEVHENRLNNHDRRITKLENK